MNRKLLFAGRKLRKAGVNKKMIEAVRKLTESIRLI
jgi:hypothetical protein